MLPWKSRRNNLQQEIEAHIDIETQENIAAGMTPEAARTAAMKKFGNPLLTLERSREVWGWVRVERLLQDLRYALRNLAAKNPGYTITLVLTLTLGLGSVATMLAIVDSVLLKPVALPHPEQLALLYAEGQREGTTFSPYSLGYRQIDELRRNTKSFAGLAGYNTLARPVGAQDGTRMAVFTEVTPDLFSTLGVRARLGRLILPADANAPVAVVNEEFWRTRLHSSPSAVGSTIKSEGALRTIIGVLPGSVRFPQGMSAPAVFVPIVLNAKNEDRFGIDSAAVLVRLKPGISMQQALADAQGVFQHADSKPEEKRDRLKMRSYQDSVTGDLQKPLWAMLGGVLVLLLIACANAANLQIARAASRMPEMRIRSALGASFRRILQQLIAESVLVSLVSAALGAAAAYAVVAWTRHAYGGQYARFDEVSVQPLVLLLMACIATAVGVFASLAPLRRIRRQTMSGLPARGTTRMSRTPGLLVAFQIALTCVLLVIAGLFVRTFHSLQHVELGFDPRGVTTLVLMPEDQRQDPQLSRATETRLLHRFETLPGVQSVAMQTALPFSSYNFVLDGTTDVPGRVFHEGDSAHYSLVSTGFVHASGIPLLKGRGFQTSDETSGTIAVLVNQAFVQKYFGTRDALGAILRFHRKPHETDADVPLTQPMTIVGVVQNELEGGDLGAPYQPMVYVDYLQLPKESFLSQVFSMGAQYAVRSNLPFDTLAGELRSVVQKEAPTFAEMNLVSMEESISNSLSQRRLALRLVSGFGAVALVLSAIGIYGVLAYSVSLRRREIGVRMALGSSRLRVTNLVVRQAAVMVLFGTAAGIFGAWLAGHIVQSFLFGVKVLDAETLLAVACLLLLVSGVAACVPTLRAATIDPMETLRVE